MIQIKTVKSTHYLYHAARFVSFVFNILEDGVQITRYEKGLEDYRRTVDLDYARWLYGDLKSQGYTA